MRTYREPSDPAIPSATGTKPTDLTNTVSDIKIIEENNEYYLTAIYKNTPVRERILRLDAERFDRGDLPLSHLLDKYLSYILY